MKRIMVTVFATVVALVSVGLMAPDAEARRLGGGMSSGMTRSSTVMKRDAIPAKPAAPGAASAPVAGAPAAPARSGMSRWMGPIAGLAAGLGIAALLSHFGLGEGMANFVMIALLVVAAIVLRLLFGRRQPQNNLQYESGNNNFQPQYQTAQQFSPVNGGGSVDTGAAPADFDVDGFLRQAKLNFVRLQAANDAGDMPDISHFTSPELFAEIQMQYQERGRTTQQTDVVQLNADLLDVSEEGSNTVASVRFHGQIREAVNAAPEYFNEVWHLLRPHDGSRGWTVAGIQQAE